MSDSESTQEAVIVEVDDDGDEHRFYKEKPNRRFPIVQKSDKQSGDTLDYGEVIHVRHDRESGLWQENKTLIGRNFNAFARMERLIELADQKTHRKNNNFSDHDRLCWGRFLKDCLVGYTSMINDYSTSDLAFHQKIELLKKQLKEEEKQPDEQQQ